MLKLAKGALRTVDDNAPMYEEVLRTFLVRVKVRSIVDL